MARNIARDEREAGRRKKQMPEAGFDLFSRHGIEAVSLQMVAETADVGIATLYKYYQNKLNLVVAISASVWETVWNEVLQAVGLEALENRIKKRRFCACFDELPVAFAGIKRKKRCLNCRKENT